MPLIIISTEVLDRPELVDTIARSVDYMTPIKVELRQTTFFIMSDELCHLPDDHIVAAKVSQLNKGIKPVLTEWI